MIGSKLTIGMGIALLVMSAAFALHYKISQNRIESLNKEIGIEQTARALAESKTTFLISHIERQTELLSNLAQQQAEIQRESKEMQKLLADHDLQKLALAKPGLIEKRANEATAEVLAELEGL